MRRIMQLAVVLSFLATATGIVPVRASAPPPGSQDNPVPMGKPILLALGTVREYVAIAEVNRGAYAWARIQRYSILNGPPAPGKEYLMALVVVKYISGPQEQADLNFVLLSNNQLSLSAPRIVHVRPDFQILFTPETMSGGWIVREVDPNDPNPLLMVTPVGNNNSQQQVIYFAATDPEPPLEGGTQPGPPAPGNAY